MRPLDITRLGAGGEYCFKLGAAVNDSTDFDASEGDCQMWVEFKKCSATELRALRARKGLGHGTRLVVHSQIRNLRYSPARQSRNQIARSGMKFRVYAAIADTLVT